MKEIPTLAAEKRDGTGTRSSRRLRRGGRVPAIVYGHKKDPMPVSVDHDDLETVVRHQSRMLDLTLGKNAERVLLVDLQHDSLGREITHADFIRVAMDEVIHLDVPIVLRGQAKGEQHGGVTEQVLTRVTIECLPADIPDDIGHIISEMEIGDSVHVGDLVPPEKVKITSESTLLVVTVAVTKKAAAEAEVGDGAIGEEAEGDEPEVIAKGKDEGEEKEAAE